MLKGLSHSLPAVIAIITSTPFFALLILLHRLDQTIYLCQRNTTLPNTRLVDDDDVDVTRMLFVFVLFLTDTVSAFRLPAISSVAMQSNAE
jgi:hypothetical protein